MTGMHRSPYQGISVEFAQHRPYAAGDDIRHVDWKVYSRTEKVYLKQYLQETNLDLVLIVDASESMGFGSLDLKDARWTKYDHATAIAASLAYMAIQQQDSAGLAIFDQALSRYFKPSNSPGQWKVVVNELQQVPRWNKTSTGKILDQLAEKLTHRSVIVILSDFFDDLNAIKQGLRHLRYKKHEIMVFQILDPQEIEFPFAHDAETFTLFAADHGLPDVGVGMFHRLDPVPPWVRANERLLNEVLGEVPVGGEQLREANERGTSSPDVLVEGRVRHSALSPVLIATRSPG